MSIPPNNIDQLVNWARLFYVEISDRLDGFSSALKGVQNDVLLMNKKPKKVVKKKIKDE